MTYQYFQKYPLATFTLDNYESMQVMPDLSTRSKFLANVVTNASNYDEYDIVSGETPEITADKFYGDPGLHWIILQSNGILDPRFGWPLDQFDLKKFTVAKYGNITSTHHYEDSTGNITTNANIELTLSDSIDTLNLSNGSVLTNVTGSGVGVITDINISGNSTFKLRVPQGGFNNGDTIALASNTSITSNITATDNITNGTAITNLIHEDRENDAKRQIKIIKSDFVPSIISQFENLMKT
tara:strand:- start:955 stop:1677 length:723 start_codon:yes stop_codon:yes gene_type:complete